MTSPVASRAGGIERVVVECANQLVAAGHDVHVLATRFQPGALDERVTRAPRPGPPPSRRARVPAIPRPGGPSAGAGGRRARLLLGLLAARRRVLDPERPPHRLRARAALALARGGPPAARQPLPPAAARRGVPHLCARGLQAPDRGLGGAQGRGGGALRGAAGGRDRAPAGLRREALRLGAAPGAAGAHPLRARLRRRRARRPVRGQRARAQGLRRAAGRRRAAAGPGAAPARGGRCRPRLAPPAHRPQRRARAGCRSLG